MGPPQLARWALGPKKRSLPAVGGPGTPLAAGFAASRLGGGLGLKFKLRPASKALPPDCTGPGPTIKDQTKMPPRVMARCGPFREGVEA
jgi:hypothetical protein